MQFKSLDNKRIQNDKLRMTEPFVLFTEFQKTIATHIVDASEVGRPDLISIRFYNDPSYLELILKYNNILNPFSINEGDVLEIPDTEGLFIEWKAVKEIGDGESAIAGENAVRDQFIDNKRLTVPDQKRIEYLQKKAAQKKNGPKQILPPNILKTGDTNIDIINDSIII